MPATATVPRLGEEAVPPGEDEAIRVITEACLEMLDRAAAPVPRQQHAKGQGGVRAELRVGPDVPPALRHGLFREPRTYQALVRFSNGRRADESRRDAHGMAIKLFGVPGAKVLEGERDATTHDLVLLDHPTFFIRNAVDYAAFARAMVEGFRLTKRPWARLLPARLRELLVPAHMFRAFFRTHRREARLIRAVPKAPPPSPLRHAYWSATPYRFGPHAVRYHVRPWPAAHLPAPEPGPHDPADRLRAALAADLARGGATFDVLVQRQTDAASMPVEDPTVPWDELASPMVRVATLHVPMQEFDTARKRELVERLAFTPWHALPEHRPLGGINRARRHVYETLARRRRELNDMPAAEPDARWLDQVWDAPPRGVPAISAGVPAVTDSAARRAPV